MDTYISVGIYIPMDIYIYTNSIDESINMLYVNNKWSASSYTMFKDKKYSSTRQKNCFTEVEKTEIYLERGIVALKI